MPIHTKCYEDVGSMFIRNVRTFFQYYTAFVPKNENTEIKSWFCKLWYFCFYTVILM